MATSIFDLARQFGGVVENTKPQPEEDNILSLARQFGGEVVETSPAEVAVEEPINPEEQRRLGPTGPVGFGVLDLLVAPFAREKDPRLTGVARGAELLGSGLEATARGADILPEAAPPTTPVISTIKSAAPQLQEWANNLSNWGKQFDSEYATDLGSLTENPANAVPFIIERFIGSLPDMAAATYALPAYIPALANDILNQRLENDGKTIEQATIGDVAAATAAAAIQGPLERFATRRLGEPSGVLGQTAFQAGTEAAQEVTQYAAETAGTQVGFDPEQAGLIGLEAGIVGGGIGAAAGAINTADKNAIRRDIEDRFRRGEDVRSEEELVELDRLREKAFEDAKGIVAPELPVEADPLKFGTAYSERIYDSIGQYIPVNEEFKVEEKVVDGIARFVVTDRNGTQYGQTLGNKSQADSLSNSLNNTTQERAKVIEQLYPLQRSLSEVMKGYGLNDVAVSIDKRIFTRRGKALTSEGLFDPVVRQVFLAVDAIDPQGTLDTTQRREALRGVLRHEVVHALRYLDLWKKSEWKNLEKTVSTLKKPGTEETYLQIASKNYGDQSKVIQVEEAVAELIRDVAGNLSKVAGKPRNLSERAINFFDRAKNALTGSGFQTYEDIVRRVEEGIVGSRQRGRIRTLRATEEQMGYQGITPERIQPLFNNPEERNRFRKETAQKIQTKVPATNQPALNSLRLNAVRESRSTIDPVPPKIRVDEQEVPTRDSEGRLIYSGYEGPEVFGIETRPTMEGLQNFWRSFKGSKAVDKQGRPQLYLHGTAGDITAFRPKQAGAVFVTRNIPFAESFGDLSNTHMIANFPDFIGEREVLDVLNESMRSATTPKFYDRLEKIQKRVAARFNQGKGLDAKSITDIKELYTGKKVLGKTDIADGVSSNMIESIERRLPSNANLVPVYVNAQNPFDYENNDDVKRVIKRVKEISPVELDSGDIEGLRKGDWVTIEGLGEASPILDAIKSLGYDSMYIEESGIKNLAVFNPNQIKSAIGNNGNFDITTPSIRESRVRNPQLDTPEFQRFFRNSKVVDEANQPLVVYHGTDRDIDAFKASRDGGALGTGIYFSPSAEFAGQYAQREGGNVVPAYVSLKNPLIIDGSLSQDPMIEALMRLGVPQSRANSIVERAYDTKGYITTEVKSRAQKEGFDGILQYKNGQLGEVVAFNPNQIKSAVGNIGAFDITRPSIREARKRKEPVSPLQAIITPEEAEGRIRRRMEREPGVGAPRNERIEFASPDGKKLVVGKITTADWLERVTTLLTMPEIQDARAWYRQLSDALRPLYGPDASKWALAWLMSQKRASPTKGFTDVLRASDIARGKIKVKGAGLNEQALIDILQDKVPEGGVGPKLLDFLDSELGKVTRTVVRGDVRGRQPAAIDVWAQRDIGFIDETTLEFIRKVFGEQAASQLQVDKTTGGETQYEYGIDFYNNVAEMLNGMRFDGGGWTAAEVQAVGWVTMQRAMGIQAEFVRDIIGGNTRRISIGLAPGANSILADKLAGKEIPPEVAQREIQTLADLAGIKVKQNVAGVGAYLQWVEGAIQIDAVASPEAVDDFMDMVGYVFQQTEVINTRSLPSGKNMAIDIMAPAFATVDGSTSFFSKFLNYAPKDKNGDPLAPGFQQINIDGMPGIRFLNFGGNWRKQQVNEIIDAANKTADDLDVDLGRTIVSQVVLTSTKNDWSEKKDGEAYLSSLRDRGRLQEVELLQRRYPPSRIDIQGDGSILWGEREAAEDARLAGQAEAIVPRGREARVTGPASVTEPGPDTDIDTTGAAEALNEGQPVNSLGIPVGPLLTYTMPDGTVAPRARESRTGDPIRGAKIDPVMKRLIRSVEFFESAPDKLRGGVGLGDIASRIENYYDTWDARLGEVNNIIRNVTNSMSRSELRSAQDTFERYITARENNRAQDAADIFRNATPNDRQLISAWESITNITGRVNRDVRGPDGEPIKVWDSKQEKWRPIGTIRDFFPRTLRREVMEVMMNPDLDPLLYDQLLDAVVTSGKAQTRDEAEEFLLRDYFSDEVKSDYFAGVEKARTEALPEIFYDYSWNAATRYLNKWARRTSQIEYFGQELGPFKKDWFDTNIPKIRNRETQDYLNQIKDRIYEVETFGFWNNAMKWGNQLATGLQLANPASAFLNVVGGDVANIQMYGWREVAKAHASLLLDWRRVQEEGTKLGILNKDYLRITQDGIERDAGKYFATEDKVSVALSKFTDVALTFSGFNGAENIVRATAMLAARGFLDSSLKAINRNPNSNKSKKFIEYVKRENLDLDKLILENGAGPETDKFMRRGVNVPQGSYRIDMTPVFVDTNVGRFFFKYQKFGTQINRFFYRNFFKPWWDDKTDALKFLRLLAFLFPAIFGGEIINQFRRFLGYSGDYGPTYAQIAKAFEKDETALGWGLIISRAMQNVTVAGSFGFFGNYYQFGKDVMDQQRVKNPMSPPALSSVDALIDLGYRLYDQGQLTARDFDEIAENTMSFYRANKRIALAGMSELGSEAKEVKRFVAQKDIREIRRYGLRYAQDMEIEGKRQRTSSGPPVRTEMTPTNKAIVDALYQGDSATARALIKQALKGKNFKEKQKINQSIRASIRNRQPIQIGGSSPNNQERVAFLRWAKKNLSAEEYQKIVTMDRRYRRTAARVNMGFGDD